MKKRYSILKFENDELKVNGHCIRRLCYMGIPMGLQYSITAIGSVILQTAVNGLGSLVVATVTAGSKISMFLSCPFDALGSTMATYAGQNVGAKKLDRVSEGIKSSLKIGSIYTIIAFITAFLTMWFCRLVDELNARNTNNHNSECGCGNSNESRRTGNNNNDDNGNLLTISCGCNGTQNDLLTINSTCSSNNNNSNCSCSNNTSNDSIAVRANVFPNNNGNNGSFCGCFRRR